MKVSRIFTSMAAAIAATALTACVVPYKEPVSGPTSSLKFINDYKNTMGAYTYDGPELCTDRKGLGGIKPNTERTLSIPANKRIVVSVAIDLGFQPAQLLMAGGAIGGLLAAAVYKGCIPTLDFVPQEGQEYIFRIDKELTSCAYHFEMASSPNVTVPLKYTEREWTRPAGEAGPFCAPSPSP